MPGCGLAEGLEEAGPGRRAALDRLNDDGREISRVLGDSGQRPVDVVVCRCHERLLDSRGVPAVLMPEPVIA